MGVNEEAVFGVIVAVWVSTLVGLLVPVGVPETTMVFTVVNVWVGSKVCPVVG